MNKEKFIPISIFSLALSLIISSLIIANAMKNYLTKEPPKVTVNNASNEPSNQKIKEVLPVIMDAKQVGELFHLSDSMLIGYINAKKLDIPYIKIGDEYYFSRDAFLKWTNETHDLTIKLP